MVPPSVSLPVEDPVLVFGLAMVVFLTAPLVLQRYRLPGIVGIIVAGAVVGPNGLGLLARDDTIVLLGEVGLIYLLFVAGLEIDFDRFLESADRSVVFGLLSFLVPQVVGTVVGYVVFGFSIAAAALFAAVFSSHTLLAYPIVSRLGIATDESVATTVGGTILTDTLALLVLAVAVASVEEGIGVGFWLELTVGLALFFAGVWVLVPRLGRWFFRTVDQESYYEFLFVMAVLFACAVLAEVAGVEPIVGAFLAGLVLNRLIPRRGPLLNRIEFVGNALFIPFFLLSVGMLVDVRVLVAGGETLAIAGAFIVLTIITKYAAAWLTAYHYDYSSDQLSTMFGLSVGQAAAALAIVLVGFDVGLLDEHVINAVVILVVVASVLGSIVVDRSGRAIARATERSTYDPDDVPQRIMMPISPESQYHERLFDLALALHRPSDPIYTLTVVEPGPETETDPSVAEAEALLEDVEAYGAGAEVPVERRTRIDHNVASGIVRATVENRITTLVVGWDGARSRRQRVFGDVIDRVLVRTTVQVFVARIRRPLNVTERLVLLCPPEIVDNQGFGEAAHRVGQLADHAGADVRAVTIGGDADRVEHALASVDTGPTATIDRVDGWEEVSTFLRDEIGPDDLVVAVSARRGTVGWHPELRTLPNRIATRSAGNFVVLYPARRDRDDDRRYLQLR
ncbi:cation:proton antiporter [Natrialbaceae archaeon AArc-T1-2]|uniref:cation:proton antiporter n=1 Tax=Natrialbaceae archaeon AArc-T1-2 TaxID=3053904 RepID=UPI00255B2A94|nr:cation:proton antiporter [Natrialbaceae archaeon AArc-T1-2]WIV67739.1 cation:proton antiporter [Natrialbaceae archaeon AArc-T1-2]